MNPNVLLKLESISGTGYHVLPHVLKVSKRIGRLLRICWQLQAKVDATRDRRKRRRWKLGYRALSIFVVMNSVQLVGRCEAQL